MSDKKQHTTVQYTRLTHADKLPDRFLTSQVYTPADPESQHQGMIFSQIEILNPWFPTSQVGQTIINTVIREYYRASDTSELNNLETALKKVNETLAQVTQSGETDWIGNLHGILILINDKDIHISQTGQTQAYLFRGGKVNHITEGLMDESGETHPLRTFSNITSGTLQAGDRIVIGNPLFFKTIDLDTASDIVSGNPPAIAAQEFAKLLKQNRANSGEALVIEITTKEEAANLPLEYKVDTIYLDQGGMGSMWHSMRGAVGGISLPAFGKFGSSIKSGLSKADEKLDKHVTPHVKNIANKSYSATKNLTGKALSKIKKPKPEQETGELAPPNRMSNFVTKTKSKMSPLTQTVTQKFDFAGGDTSPRGRSRKYAIWGIALIIVLLVLIFASRIPLQNTLSTSETNMQDTVTSLSDRFSKVKLLSAYNDKDVALEELASILSEINELETSGELPASLTELKKQAIDELGNLTSTSDINNVEEVADWGDRPLAVGFDDTVYPINNYTITEVPGNKDTSVKELVNKLSAVTGNTDGDKVYLLSNKKLAQYNTGDNSVSDVKLDAGEWPWSPSFKEFSGNLYILDSTGGRVLKYEPSDDGFSEGEEFGAPEGDELKDAVSLAVNGNVVVLKNDGSLVALGRSGREAIDYSNLPSDGFVKNAKAVFATSESNEIYILHEDKWVSGLWRLSRFSRSGEYLGGYFIPSDLSNWTAIDFDVNDKVLWIVTESSTNSAKLSE